MVEPMGGGRWVVVRGSGIICPTGIGTENAWKAILAGRSGMGPVTLFDATPFPCRIAGEVPAFDPLDFVEKKDVKKTARFIHFALAATEFAVRHAGLDMKAEHPDRVRVFVRSAVAGFESIHPHHPKLTTHDPS